MNEDRGVGTKPLLDSELIETIAAYKTLEKERWGSDQEDHIAEI